MLAGLIQYVFIISCITVFSHFSFAQEFETPRGLALAGALRGTIGLNESLYYNPATLPFAQRYSIEAQSSFLPSRSQNNSWIYSGSVVDATSPLFSAGFGYFHKTQEGSKNSENAFHLALSKALHRFISFGLTGKYFWINTLDRDSETMNLDMGVFGLLTPRVHLGLVGHNVLGDRLAGNLTRQIGLGSRIKTWEFLYASLDLLKKVDGPFLSNTSFHGALEIVRENGFSVQGGLSLSDIASKNVYGLGLGWAKHKVGIFYAFQNSMDSLRKNIHALGLRIFF